MFGIWSSCTSRSHLTSRHSEVPAGVLMDAAAPGEGEAVPLQKLIGFGMVGGYLWNGWGSCPGSSIPFYRPWLGACTQMLCAQSVGCNFPR